MVGSYAEIDRAYEFGQYDYGSSGIIMANFYNPTTLYTSNTTSAVTIKFAIKAVNTSCQSLQLGQVVLMLMLVDVLY